MRSPSEVTVYGTLMLKEVEGEERSLGGEVTGVCEWKKKAHTLYASLAMHVLC